jgi:hypothetical protein
LEPPSAFIIKYPRDYVNFPQPPLSQNSLEPQHILCWSVLGGILGFIWLSYLSYIWGPKAHPANWHWNHNLNSCLQISVQREASTCDMVKTGNVFKSHCQNGYRFEPCALDFRKRVRSCREEKPESSGCG